MRNPIQPLHKDEHGTIRFKHNRIVQDLLAVASEHGFSLNEIACRDYTNDDRQQLAQLIGYSLRGYSELTNYVDEDAYNAAVNMAEGMDERNARIAALQAELDAVRSALVQPMARLFGIHPDDLMESEDSP